MSGQPAGAPARLADWPAVAAWRKARRAELIERRAAMPVAERRALGAAINALLEAAFALPPGKVVAFCWPYRGEADVRFAIRTLRAQGAIAALPAVLGLGRPLEFREWSPGVAMVAGALGIPFPAATRALVPHAAFVPLVGFDAQGYRLGYGAGLFDRTLAALPVKPLAVGVGFELARLATIHPQAHDVPMDFIVTEAGISAVEGAALVALSAAEARERARSLVARRGL